MDDLTLKLEGEFDGRKIGLSNVPLAATAASLEALRKLVTRTSKRPEDARVSIETGSIAVRASLPADSGIILSASVRKGRLPETDPYAEFLRTMERITHSSGLVCVILEDGRELTRISPTEGSNITIEERVWLTTSLIVYGQLYNMGGKIPNINIHIETEEYGKLKIDIDAASIKKLQLYSFYNFEVEGSMLRSDPTQLQNLKFIHAIKANGDISPEKLIALEGPKWKEITDPNRWLDDLRGNQ